MKALAPAVIQLEILEKISRPLTARLQSRNLVHDEEANRPKTDNNRPKTHIKPENLHFPISAKDP